MTAKAQWCGRRWRLHIYVASGHQIASEVHDDDTALLAAIRAWKVPPRAVTVIPAAPC